MSEATKPAAIEAAAVPPARPARGYPEPFAARVDGARKAGARGRVRVDQFRGELDAVAAGRHVGASPYAHARGRIRLIVEGEPVLVTNAGETPLRPGMCAGFKAGAGDAHHLINRSGRDIVYLEIGDRDPGDTVIYPDDDIGRALPRTANAFSCIGTADPDCDALRVPENTVLMARWRTLRVALDDLR